MKTIVHKIKWSSARPDVPYRPEWAKAPQLHHLIGHKHPDAQKRQTAINMAIEGMEKSGEVKALRAKYFADINVKRSKP
ncbi:MAG: hypothetical protein WCH60_01040 [Burkholderiales bacterium]